jgi:hypothetical protein
MYVHDICEIRTTIFFLRHCGLKTPVVHCKTILYLSVFFGIIAATYPKILLFSAVILYGMNAAKLFSAVCFWCGITLKVVVTFQVIVDLIWKSLLYHYCQYYFII